MIDLELERKAFEKWYTDLRKFPDFVADSIFVRDSEDCRKYYNYNTQESFEIWQELQSEIAALKAKLEKVESGEFVVVPKSEIGNYYFDDSECIYIDEPDSFLSELDVGEVCEVKRRDYFDLPTQYAAKVFIDIDNIEWRLFESELEAEIAANECKDKFWGEQGDGDE